MCQHLCISTSYPQRLSGHKLALSFDEATFMGSDRYLTLNVHHIEPILGNSRVVPHGLVRVSERATGKYLQTVICHRLADFHLTTDDFVAAATDAGSHVIKAVELMGLRIQKCLWHQSGCEEDHLRQGFSCARCCDACFTLR